MAFRSGRTPIPRSLILWTALVIAALGLGGTALERVLGNGASASSIPTTTLVGTGPPSSQIAPTVPSLGGSLDRFMGLKRLSSSPAPIIDGLSGPTMRPWTLYGAQGKVVVLTFFDVDCHDICPVLSEEIKQADAALGASAATTEFVVINTNPSATKVETSPPALTTGGLDALHNVIFLNGELPHLNASWVSYGVQVAVAANGTTLHNDVMYFIDPQGRLRTLALPFANQAPNGSYSLPGEEISRFAAGIASTAVSISGPRP